MQKVKQIPTLQLNNLNRAVATTASTNNAYDATEKAWTNAQQINYNEYMNYNSTNNNNVVNNIETALDPPEIPTTRGPHHINCNSPSVRANINILSNNNEHRNNDATVKISNAWLCRPPSHPPSRFTTPRVDLTNRFNQQENYTEEVRNAIMENQNHIHSSQLKTQNEALNHVQTFDLKPNSNSIRFSMARSEPSIIFRVHNDNTEGNNNNNETFVLNSNISSTVPLYRWSDAHDGRESYVPFQITRENSPALTILNVQSVDDNALYSRLSSDIHFMTDDVKPNSNNNINSNSNSNNNQQNDLLVHTTEHNEPHEQQQQQQEMLISQNVIVHDKDSNAANKKMCSDAKRVMSSMASSINFVEYSASSRSDTLNFTDTTQMNVESELQQKKQQQDKVNNREWTPQSATTNVSTLKLNNVAQRATTNNNKNNNQTAQTARTNRNRGNYSSRVAITARSGNQHKNNNNNNKETKTLVPANAVSARTIVSTSNEENTRGGTAAIKQKRRPFIPSSRNAHVIDVNSARSKSTEHITSPLTMREFAHGNVNMGINNNNELKENNKNNEVVNNKHIEGEEEAANNVERIRHNAHYERPWRVTARSSSLPFNRLPQQQETQEPQQEEKHYRANRNKINWESSSTPLRLPPLRFSGKPLVSFHDQWITHHHHNRKPPVMALTQRRKRYEHINSNNNNNFRRYSNNNAEIKQKIANTLNANLERDSHQDNFTNATFLRQISTPQSTEQASPSLPQHQEFVQKSKTEKDIIVNDSINNNDRYDNNINTLTNNINNTNDDIYEKGVEYLNAVHLYTPRPRSNYTKPWRADIATPRGQRRDVWRDAFIQEGATSNTTNIQGNGNNNRNVNNMEKKDSIDNNQVQEHYNEQPEEIYVGDISKNVNQNQYYYELNDNGTTTNAQQEQNNKNANIAQGVDEWMYSNNDDAEALPRAMEETPLPHPRSTHGSEPHQSSSHSRVKKTYSLENMPTQNNNNNITMSSNNYDGKQLSYEEHSIGVCQLEQHQEQQQKQESNNDIDDTPSDTDNVKTKSDAETNRNTALVSKTSILSYLEREVDEWMQCVTQEKSLFVIQNFIQRRQIDLQNTLTSFNYQSDKLREVTWELYRARDVVLQIREEQQQQQTNSIHYYDASNEGSRKLINNNNNKSSIMNDESRNHLMNNSDVDNSHYYINNNKSNNNISNSEYSTSDHVNYVIHHPPERDTIITINTKKDNNNNNGAETEKHSLSFSPFDIHKLINETGNSTNALIANKRVSRATRRACQQEWTQWEGKRHKLLNELHRLRQQHDELQFHLRRGTHIKPLLLSPSNSNRRLSLQSANEQDIALHFRKNNDHERWTSNSKEQKKEADDDDNEYKALIELRLHAQECTVSVERKEAEWQLLRRRCAENKQQLLQSLHEVQDHEALELEHLHQTVQAMEENLRELVALRRNVQQNTMLHPITRRNALQSINHELEHGENVLNANKNRLLLLERSAASSLKRMAKRESIDYEYEHSSK